MDWMKLGKTIPDFLKKYRYVVLVVAVGVVLMVLPEGKKTEPPSPAPTQPVQTVSMEEQLAEILSQVEGAGKVKVMLTVAKSEQTIYQSDTGGSGQLDTVVVSGSDRQEQGLVQQVISPEYRGAIVLCQGADRASVRLAIVQAVSGITGLGADHITVLKMK